MKNPETLTSHRLMLAVLAITAGIFLLTKTDATASSCEVPSGLFPTIQSAIADISCTEINVAPGIYTEQVTIDRSLELKGSEAGPTVIQAPSIMTGPKAIVRVTGATTDATVEHLTIQGPGSGSCDSLRYGVRVDDGASATIRHNRILAIRDNPLGGCQNGVAVLIGRKSESQVGRAIVSHNHIEDYQKGGIVVSNTGSTATVSHNIVQGGGFRCCGLAAQNGIQISGGGGRGS